MTIQILLCPKCELPAHLHHIGICTGDSVLCDICGLAVRNSYHAVYRHYQVTHGGKFGKVRGKCEGQKPKIKGQYKKKNNPHDDTIITMRLVIPYQSGTQKIIFNKDYATWVRLSKQPLSVFDSKDQDELALMAAIETFKIEYLQ